VYAVVVLASGEAGRGAGVLLHGRGLGNSNSHGDVGVSCGLQVLGKRCGDACVEHLLDGDAVRIGGGSVAIFISTQARMWVRRLRVRDS